MEKNIRLFVDMDGTLATFNPVSKMETLYEKGYFENLTPMSNMVNAIKNLIGSKDIEVYTLSACLDSPYAKKEKNTWLDKHLPEIDTEHRIYCEYGKDKSVFIHEPRDSDVLLDDYSKNLNSWHGVGIKVLNGINDTNKTWKGERISSFCEANILAYTIKNVMLKSIANRSSVKKEKEMAQAIFRKADKADTVKESTHER